MHNRAASCATVSRHETHRNPRAIRALLPWLFASAGLPTAVARRKRIPTHEDIWLMKRVGAPQVSPDGRWIVVSVVEPSYDDNAQLSDLWLIDTSARNSSRRLTSTRRPENGVVWSPDSRRIVFSAQRDNDDVPQLYSLDLAAGGEAQRLTNLSGGARAPVFSHDGRQLAFVSIMYPQAPRRGGEQGARSRRIATRKSNARIFDGFPVRSWDHWLDERQARIFVQALDADGLPRGRAARPAGRHEARRQPRIRRPPDRYRRGDRNRVHARQQVGGLRGDHQSQPGRVRVHRRAAVHRRTWRGGEPRAITTGSDQLVAAALHARRQHAARGARRAGPERLQRGAPRRLLLAEPGQAPHRHRRHRSRGEQLTPSRRIRARCTSPPRMPATRSCTRCASAAARCRRCSASSKGSYTNLVIPERAGKPVAVRQLGERQRPGRGGADHADERQGAGADQVQRRARRAARPAADREFLVHLEPRQAHPQLPGASAGLRRDEEVSAVRRDPRRPARHVARPVLRPLELSPAGRARLRAAAD